MKKTLTLLLTLLSMSTFAQTGVNTYHGDHQGTKAKGTHAGSCCATTISTGTMTATGCVTKGKRKKHAEPFDECNYRDVHQMTHKKAKCKKGKHKDCCTQQLPACPTTGCRNSALETRHASYLLAPSRTTCNTTHCPYC